MKAARILIVEDEGVVAWHVQEALIKLGYQVVAIAATARDAIQLASEHQPDLTLMDICLQGSTIDGVSAAEQVYLRLDIPVVYLTAHADAQTLQRATNTSPFGYLVKPFHEADLHSTIQIALRRHQLEQALKAVQQWYATTLVSIGDATIATDVDGFVAFMNPTAEVLTGWTQEQALGAFATQVVELVDEETGQAIDNPILAALCQGDTITIPERAMLRSRDGSARPVGDSASPIRNRKGEIIGGVMVFQDISDRRRLEQRLQQQNHSLAIAQDQLHAQLRERTVQFQQAIACTQLVSQVLQQFAQRSAAPSAEMLSDQDVLNLLLQEVGQTLKAEFCWITMHHPPRSNGAFPEQSLTAPETATIVGEYRSRERSPVGSPVESLVGEQIRLEEYASFYLRLARRGSWIDPAPEVLPEVYRSLLAARSRSGEPSQVIVCPIEAEQQVIGELGLIPSSPVPWSSLQAELVVQSIRQAAIALHQAYQLQKARSQVEGLSRLSTLKDEFLHALGRELRTPLTNMRMVVEMLQRTAQLLQASHALGNDDKADPQKTDELWQKLERYLHILRQEWQVEFELVNELLDFQTVQAQTLGRGTQSIVMQQWLPELVARFQARSRANRQHLSCRIPENFPTVGVSLPVLERIVTELLDNACHFTPPDHEIRVSVQVRNNRLQLSVLNTGTQLSESERSQIFAPFHRRLTPIDGKPAGFGLGLTLVQGFAIALNGNITVTSEAEVTEFIVTIPLVDR